MCGGGCSSAGRASGCGPEGRGFEPHHPPQLHYSRPEAGLPAMKRRAKIVCTLGPATSSPEKIRELVDAGMDVARLNLSHGTREEHAAVYKNVRAASDAAQRAVAVLVDLQGPKIRLGEFEDGGVTLAAGDRFTITTEPVEGTRELRAPRTPRWRRTSWPARAC